MNILYAQIVCNELPVTNYHLDNENPVKKVFYGRIDIENATSFLLFHKKSNVHTLIHQSKYKGNKEISSDLGTWARSTLSQFEDYQNIHLSSQVRFIRKS